MKLNKETIKNRKAWEAMGIKLPIFDIDALQEKTNENPEWLHFGGGNIFRVFIAAACQKAVEANKVETGIVVAESYDDEIIDRFYNETDNLSLSVMMNANGNFNKEVIASVTKALKCTEDYTQLLAIAKNPALKMMSFTITEKGYALKGFDGNYFPFILKDIENGPEKPGHVMGIVTSLLYERYKNGAANIALVSMDNCSHNGEKLGNAVKDMAQKWQEKSFVDVGFIDYINDESRVSFPFTMIDKITPRPAESVKQHLDEIGLEGMDIIVTDKKSYTAAFVNAEVCEYLIIEDKFPNGKIAIESDRIIFTDRQTVNNVETMKVTTCLNPLHTALAVTGCVLGHTSISDEMKDDILVKLIHKIGYAEGLKVVLDPKILDPKAFIDEVVNERFANAYIPDTPQRIAMDTSQKVGIRFGVTIQSYVGREDLDAETLVGIPLAIAAWCRYLMGIDDEGNAFEISADPMKETLTKYFSTVQLGDKDIQLNHILSNAELFGSDLYCVGLGEKIEGYFNEMILGKGAVRATLEKYLQK
jgi:fructuronate reductase